MANVVTDPNVSNSSVDIGTLISQALGMTPAPSASSTVTPASGASAPVMSSPIPGTVAPGMQTKACCGSCANGLPCEGGGKHNMFQSFEKYEPILWLVLVGLVVYAITMKK